MKFCSIPSICMVFLASSCGLPASHNLQAHEARTCDGVQVWAGSEALKQAKQTVLAACAGKADQQLTALVVAMLMAETTDGQASQRDASKDGTPGANRSAFNMNDDFLGRLGWKAGEGPDLNDQANLGVATEWLLKGIAKFGQDGALNFHRGGACGLADGVSYGCAAYRQSMHAVQQRLLAEPALLTSQQRVGLFIEHV